MGIEAATRNPIEEDSERSRMKNGPLFILWIERLRASLFQLSEEFMKRDLLRSDSPEALFSEIIPRLDASGRLLIVGPELGDAPQERFREHLLLHCPSLSRTIISCETLPEPSDSTIAALAERYLHFQS